MNTIISMKHSPLHEPEPEGQPLERERNLNALYSELIAVTSPLEAGQFGRSMTGMPYLDKCAAVLEALVYVAAWTADGCPEPDPRSDAERDLDAWQVDTYRTQRDARPY